MVNAADNDVAGKMVADPRVAFFSFIGSARVGWMLRSMLAPGARLWRLSMAVRRR